MGFLLPLIVGFFALCASGRQVFPNDGSSDTFIDIQRYTDRAFCTDGTTFGQCEEEQPTDLWTLAFTTSRELLPGSGTIVLGQGLDFEIIPGTQMTWRNDRFPPFDLTVNAMTAGACQSYMTFEFLERELNPPVPYCLQAGGTFPVNETNFGGEGQGIACQRAGAGGGAPLANKFVSMFALRSVNGGAASNSVVVGQVSIFLGTEQTGGPRQDVIFDNVCVGCGCAGEAPCPIAAANECFVPTTEAPTTEVPVTEAPTTEEPTTEEPTTEEPTTVEPTTEEPITETPTTEEPTTETPTTEEPTTETPTTEEPTTETPTTEAPTTEEPTTEAPTTEAPATEEPTTEAPTTEAPATEAPTTEEPATEEPTTAEPVTEEPTTEAPATEAPTTEAPATEAPTTESPATESPTTEEPEATTTEVTTAPVMQGPCSDAVCDSRAVVLGVNSFTITDYEDAAPTSLLSIGGTVTGDSIATFSWEDGVTCQYGSTSFRCQVAVWRPRQPLTFGLTTNGSGGSLSIMIGACAPQTVAL